MPDFMYILQLILIILAIVMFFLSACKTPNAAFDFESLGLVFLTFWFLIRFMFIVKS